MGDLACDSGDGGEGHVQERAEEGRAIAKVIWHLFERIGVAAWDQRIADEMERPYTVLTVG